MSYANITGTINSLKTQTNAVNYEKNKAYGNDTVNQDVFLQLMVTQLQHQDPLNPMDNTEFLSQQAMFSQVTTLQEMNENLTKYGDAILSMNGSALGATSLTQAMNFIGKEITAINPENKEETITGTVESVKVTEDGIVFTIDGKDIHSELVQGVNGSSTKAETSTEEENSLKDSAKDFLSDILKNPKLKSAATNLIEKLAGEII